MRTLSSYSLNLKRSVTTTELAASLASFDTVLVSPVSVSVRVGRDDCAIVAVVVQPWQVDARLSFETEIEVSDFVNASEAGLHLFDVKVVFTGVVAEVLEDGLLLCLGDPSLLESASHSSSSFFLADHMVVVSINLVEDVFNLDI